MSGEMLVSVGIFHINPLELGRSGEPTTNQQELAWNDGMCDPLVVEDDRLLSFLTSIVTRTDGMGWGPSRTYAPQWSPSIC